MSAQQIQVLRALAVGMLAVALGVGCAATDDSRSTGQFVDDTTIAARVKAKLLDDDVTDGLDIDVEVNRDRVQLNGFVDSIEQKRRAEELARSVPGVAGVENNLDIGSGDRRVGQYIDDKSLATRVKAALADDPVAPAHRIDVEVNDGAVSLGGYVETDAQRQAAIAATERVKGVRRVVDNLTID